ncbi:F-box protein 9 [Sporothrix schenckii 1099-18]|uniref:F-box domain-containing protein n=2 Tax=Sporothrix schenckii TaxID=29908 RepID=U7Q2P4_SPOS1|nr:F-box protein 9 [Sporothrix schenckii 1099-18]ERT02133.1 hypothetical protein HMPREF1624_00431 [Sporothrix schenckii ATCC 58251]KJR80654.1 F-box protein 9 [Sporothrix schenckii 1099-18]
MSQPPPSGDGSGDISSELESFRQQWRAEVEAKVAPSGAAATGSSSAASTSLKNKAVTKTATAPDSESPATAPHHHRPPQAPQRPAGPRRRGSSAGGPQTPLKLLSSGKKPIAQETDDEYAPPRAFDDVTHEPRTVQGASVSSAAAPALDEGSSSVHKLVSPSAHQEQKPKAKKEPESALEHYERAVEKEALGSLGDSLRHYRTAFRMDSNVDKAYKKKHYPAPPPAAAGSSSSRDGKQPEGAGGGAASTAPAKPVRQEPPPTLKELISSFAGLTIEGAPPPIEGMPAPPCPLAELPDELLVHILRDVALDDVGDFVRLAQVCRKLAFLVATEDRIWRRVCVGPEFGFADMYRAWERTIAWGPLEDDNKDDEFAVGDGMVVSAEAAQDERRRQRQASSLATTMKLRKGIKVPGTDGAQVTSIPPAYPSWQRMFRLRPRIRFNGCYISTVNYIRPGQPTASLVVWGNPVHIVTYFRYLRFFRDGTVISLLTTSEPPDVIHHLTKDLLTLHQGGAMAHLPSIVMQNALRGRWRMSGIADEEDGEGGAGSSEDELRSRDEVVEGDARVPKKNGVSADATESTLVSPFSSLAAASDAESDVVVETEGVGKYYYRMELAFRSAGKGTRNNKLNWRGFYSYDRLTDDWGEFGLKNYRPFFFSRVRSYGVGE